MSLISKFAKILKKWRSLLKKTCYYAKFTNRNSTDLRL
ncbi:hypothetical protein CKA32_000609 [Geitlerinema sp. FC II]|nr:hypothetical protein CKA32_000609 [Geitlerinema sp. FC II]